MADLTGARRIWLSCSRPGRRPLPAPSTGLLLSALLSVLLLLGGCSSGLNQRPFYEPPPDTVAPRLQVSGLGQAQEIHENTPISFLAIDEHGKVARILVTIDGGTLLDENFDSAQAATGFTLAWVPEFAGPHEVVMSAVDDSGNVNSLSLSYSIAAEAAP